MHIPVYLINLPDHAERKAHSFEQLRRCGLLDALVFTGAVNGKELSKEEAARLFDAETNARRYPKVLTPGEIGCYASHLLCWQAILASAAPVAMVIEDDVCLDVDVAEISQAISATGVAFDMVKLIGRPKEATLRTVARLGSRDLIEYLRPPSWTGAYLIGKPAARKLLQARSRFFRPVDVDLRFWWEVDPKFRLYGISPYPARHAHFPSALGRRPPSPYGILKYRWLQARCKVDYEANLLAKAVVSLANGLRSPDR